MSLVFSIFVQGLTRASGRTAADGCGPRRLFPVAGDRQTEKVEI